jgi:hypothetical protein
MSRWATSRRPAWRKRKRLCEAAGLPQGLRVTTHIVDVADRTLVERFRDEIADRHQTDKIHLLFNKRRYQRRRQHGYQQPQRMGAHVQHLLGRRL